jgi:hypothetical protein
LYLRVGDMMEHSCRITDLDLDLQRNHIIGNEGASLLARSLRNNALPNLTRLSLVECRVGDNGFMALVSALEQNTSLLHLDLRVNREFSERALLALAESLPEIKVLQRAAFNWCRGLSSAMPFLLAGLRKNTSLFRFHVVGCAPSLVPPSPAETARYVGGWMQEMERVGDRNRFLLLIRAPKERLPPRGVWPHALARQQHSLVSFLRCSVPNPNWCRVKKMQRVRKRLKIPASRRNGSAMTSDE